MNRWEKEVMESLLDSEEATMKELQKQYDRALRDIGQNVKAFQVDIDMLDAALQSDNLDDAARQKLLSQRRSKVYQKQYQEALQGQISGILDQMHGNNYQTIESYLKRSYDDAYIGTMYSIHGQGIPIITPIDQAAAVKAVLTDSKISKGLYNALGVDVSGLKKSISAEITRGIASSLSYSDIARNLNNVSKAGYSNAKRIVVTEGHRIQQASTMDAQKTAKAKGADVVKQWDSTLDGKTRDTHRRLDGQIREVDEPFEIGGMKADAPGYFGDPAEDCNCRCACLTRARWALDEDELQTLKDRAEYFGLDKTKDFEDFKKKYLTASEQYRRKTADDGHQIVDKPTYQKLTNQFVKRGGIIIRGEEADKHLEGMAYASYLPGMNTAFICDDATISDVLEEMYHAEQDRTNMFGGVLTHEVRLRREIDAQKHLLSLTERYKIPSEEVELTKKNLADYEEDLKRLLEGSD